MVDTYRRAAKNSPTKVGRRCGQSVAAAATVVGTNPNSTGTWTIIEKVEFHLPFPLTEARKTARPE